MSASPNRRNLNAPQNRPQNGLENGDPPMAQTFAIPSHVSHSYQSTPQLPWPSEQALMSHQNATSNTLPNNAMPNPANPTSTNSASQHNPVNLPNQILPGSSMPNLQNPQPPRSDSTCTIS